MIVTEGGRSGGYGLFLSKGVAGIRRGKPVFLYNLLNLKRTMLVAVTASTHHLVDAVAALVAAAAGHGEVIAVVALHHRIPSP